jgi:transcriptional regulator with XRE-family HTH domain
MTLSNSIKKYMKATGIGNKELSEKSGVPLKTVSNIVTGATDNPTLETIRALAHALGCTLDDIAEDMSKPGYYTDPEVAEIAQELYDRPELKTLFSTTRKVKKEDVEAVQQLIDRMVDKSEG